MNNTLYTDDVRRLFRDIRWPAGIICHIAEEEMNLNLIFYRDNFNSFDGEDRLHIAMLVKEFMEKVRGMGIPIYMQVLPGHGRGSQNMQVVGREWT